MAEAMDLDGQIKQNLKDAACPDDLIKEFLCFLESNKTKDGLHLLTKHRKTLLDTVHVTQKHIDCLDFMIYKLKL